MAFAKCGNVCIITIAKVLNEPKILAIVLQFEQKKILYNHMNFISSFSFLQIFMKILSITMFLQKQNHENKQKQLFVIGKLQIF